MQFLSSLADYREFRDSMFGAARGGWHPMVVVLDTTDGEVCGYGRVQESATFSTATPTVLEGTELMLEEYPLPSWAQ